MIDRDIANRAALYTTYLYYVAIDITGGPLYKIGICKRGVAGRFANLDRLLVREVREWEMLDIDAKQVESEVLREFADKRYCGPPVLAAGNTEIFTEDVLSLDA